MRWVIGGLIMVLAVAMIIAGAKGKASTFLQAIFGNPGGGSTSSSGSTASAVDAALMSLSGQSGSSGASTPSTTTPAALGSLGAPAPQLTQGRIDQGVDYSGAGIVHAVGAGTIVSTTNAGWPGGTFITELLAAPVDAAHKMVYYAEDLLAKVTPGQQVAAGQEIGYATGGSNGIEVGWADPNAIGQSLNTAEHGPYAGSGATPEGQNFYNAVSSPRLVSV